MILELSSSIVIDLIPLMALRENQYGMVDVKHEERVRGHDNFVLALQCE
jgi:hypothetical protein